MISPTMFFPLCAKYSSIFVSPREIARSRMERCFANAFFPKIPPIVITVHHVSNIAIQGTFSAQRMIRWTRGNHKRINRPTFSKEGKKTRHTFEQKVSLSKSRASKFRQRDFRFVVNFNGRWINLKMKKKKKEPRIIYSSILFHA